jgi:hypothetical protein
LLTAAEEERVAGPVARKSEIYQYINPLKY